MPPATVLQASSRATSAWCLPPTAPATWTRPSSTAQTTPSSLDCQATPSGEAAAPGSAPPATELGARSVGSQTAEAHPAGCSPSCPGPRRRHRILQVYFEQYILKAGTVEGGAGAAAARGPLARLSALLRGRKGGPDTIAVKDVTDADLWWAAEKMDGFSGERRQRPPALCPLPRRRQPAPSAHHSGTLFPQREWPRERRAGDRRVVG